MSEGSASILVVDDDEINRMVLSHDLEREGHRVTAVEDGGRALEALRAQPFDVVLLDVLMPELDGYETLARIERDEKLRHVPVIMVSALEDIESVVRCIELGAADYLPKLFDPVLLRARVCTTSSVSTSSRSDTSSTRPRQSRTGPSTPRRSTPSQHAMTPSAGSRGSSGAWRAR